MFWISVLGKTDITGVTEQIRRRTGGGFRHAINRQFRAGGRGLPSGWGIETGVTSPRTTGNTVPQRSTQPLHNRSLLVGLFSLYFLWGSSYLAFKVSFDSLPPLLSTGVCFGTAGGILLVVAACRRSRTRRIRFNELLTAALLGFLMIGLGFGCLIIGLHHLPTSTTALAGASAPMWVSLGDRLVFRHKQPARAIAGLSIGFLGIVALVGGSSAIPGLGWIALILVASMAWAAGLLAARVLPLGEDWILGSGMQLTIGGTLVAAAGVLHGDLNGARFNPVHNASILAWCYLLLTTALLGNAIFMWLVRRLPVTLVATPSYVDPIVAVLLGWLARGEHITIQAGLASVLIFVAVILIVSTPASPANPPA